jgi:hypothetical protein
MRRRLGRRPEGNTPLALVVVGNVTEVWEHVAKSGWVANIYVLIWCRLHQNLVEHLTK